MNLDLTKKINELICKKSNSNTLKIEEDYREISSEIQLLLESQEIIEKDIRLRFIGLATQNHTLLKLNEKLSHQLRRVEEELNMLKKKREEKVSRKEARANRKRLPRRDPVTRGIYDLLIQASVSPAYTSVRLRVDLTVTGI